MRQNSFILLYDYYSTIDLLIFLNIFSMIDRAEIRYEEVHIEDTFGTWALDSYAALSLSLSYLMRSLNEGHNFGVTYAEQSGARTCFHDS